jgi:hypothetical protein
MATKMKIKKMDNGGPIGRSISQKAATRKTLKDKGYIVGSDILKIKKIQHHLRIM